MHQINNDWNEYYEVLEQIRQDGSTNMWGANTELASRCHISQDLAKKVLLSWISNYDTLKKHFGW